MSLVDQIEELGAAVDAGLLAFADATHRLVEYSDGGLTRRGAESQLETWQFARARYADEFMRAEMGLAAVQAELRERGAS